MRSSFASDIAGMSFQRTPDGGFLAKRMRRVASDDFQTIRDTGSCLPAVAIARPVVLSLSAFERAPMIPSCDRQAGSGSGAVR